MPTTRRSSSGRAAVATGKQSRLSFSNRVTKPVPKSAKDSVVAASSPLKKELVHQPKVEKDDDDDHDKEAVDDEISVKADEQLQRETEQQIVHVDVTKSDAELKAAKLGDAAVQKYWRKVEAERMSKRVHQEDLTLSEKVLRYFDVSSQYGVSFSLGFLSHPLCVFASWFDGMC
jgi:DNA polymerase delta subunit 4